AAALLHSAIVVEKREALKAWTILLAILAFGFSLIGAFIVRSGVLTSVHAFANDPERGFLLLVITGIFMGGALTLFALRSSAMLATGVFQPVSREGALILNNILLAVSCFVVFVGTMWPLIAEMLWGQRLSVGPPFFNAAFTPFFLAIGAVLPLAALLPWKRAKLGRPARSLVPALILSIAIGGLAYAVTSGRSALAPFGIALGVWLVAGAATELWTRAGRGDLSGKLRRLSNLPRADWGKAVSHAGLGITFIGVAALTAYTVEDIRVANPGESYTVGRYEVTLNAVRQVEGPNYLSTMAEIDLARDGTPIATLLPEKRVYPVAGMPTTEASILNGVFRDLYVVIGDPQQGGGWAVRVFIKPFANWIWAGCIIMALGGFLSLSDRRTRVAGGARTRPNAAVPAE
ncbi:MAG: cytochrome c-type biogenesis CcmF C-terminal domain-containing protein, partial [Pseudomonadota bacterium]